MLVQFYGAIACFTSRHCHNINVKYVAWHGIDEVGRGSKSKGEVG